MRANGAAGFVKLLSIFRLCDAHGLTVGPGTTFPLVLCRHQIVSASFYWHICILAFIAVHV